MSQLLALVLARIKQPRVSEHFALSHVPITEMNSSINRAPLSQQVIAEVIGGVILGPTVMGHIPNYMQSIFPDASLPYLNLTATIGLVLFLFLTALEVDVRIVRKNAAGSILISGAGIIIPFGLGVAVAVPIYHKYVDQSISFGYFLLFTGVALSITAFPVLCRILMETRLLDTTVGLVTLAAGVGNDVVGWILLALT
jgi:Kef-type K+ transport system membrane component KefB